MEIEEVQIVVRECDLKGHDAWLREGQSSPYGAKRPEAQKRQRVLSDT